MCCYSRAGNIPLVHRKKLNLTTVLRYVRFHPGNEYKRIPDLHSKGMNRVNRSELGFRLKILIAKFRERRHPPFPKATELS